jgi:hypothetical protein
MRFSLFAAIAVGCLSFSSHVRAQGGAAAAQCQALQSKASDQLAFGIYRGATEPISNNEFAPTQLTAAAVNFRICVPVIPLKRGRLGAINIKIQVYSSDPNPPPASSGSRLVEYENNSQRYQAALAKYRTRSGGASYPSIDIADYQNYHGCSQARPHPIRSEFHLQVANQRTDDDPFRGKFVFRRDILPTCDMPQLVAEFLGGFPSLGPQVALALGRYDPRVEKIVARRSVLLQYDFRAAPPSDVQYLTYDLNRIGKDKCVRIEASYVFDSQHFSSDVVGVACILSSSD